MLLGNADGKAVLLARQGDEIFAVGASCTHYSGPLAEGILVGDTVRCPWHHACFSLRTGEATCAPALNPIPRWEVERRADSVFVTRQLPDPPARRPPARAPSSVVIVGAGAAADACADMLRREGYAGPITMIGAERDAPYDRPNLSKDYLAGTAQEEWIPLRAESFYTARGIRLILGDRAIAIDARRKRVMLESGAAHDFDALLIATGASPIALPPAVDPGGRVLYLRSLADSRTIIARAAGARTAVVIGASFIGLEVAASLRTRGLTVHVVAPEPRPLERVLGVELSDLIRSLHEARGVEFHLQRTVRVIDATGVTLDSGEHVAAELVVAGIGVHPNDELAKTGGLEADRGIILNAFLETRTPGIYAAGDVARYPDPRTHEPIRVEHWVVAQRQGQAAARNMLGLGARFESAPIFWSQHYEVRISYVGHATQWDDVRISGNVSAQDASVAFTKGGVTLALATVGRDRESLEWEAAFERTNAATVS